MFLSDASLKRPVAMTALIIGLILLGLNSFRKMGLEMMPKVDIPYVTIVTIYPGAAPGEIETDIAKRIEDAVVTIDGLKHVNSVCMESVCQTILEFEIEADVDIASNDVREKLSLITADFPEGVQDPKILKFDVNAQPIITLALKGDVPVDELYDFAANTLKDRITTIQGVADAELIGGNKLQIKVLLSEEKLSARNLSSVNVMQAIRQGIGTVPSGTVQDGAGEFTVKYDADYKDLSGLGRLTIANTGGQRCLLSDVADIVMESEDVRQTATVNGEPCITVRIIKKSGANAVAVTRNIRKAFERISQSLPGGMELIWVADSSRFIEAMNSSAWVNVIEGVFLTAGVLFLFLYDLRALFIVFVTMPVTIVIGVFLMQIFDYSFNAPTLIAIGLSVGVLVTNSIVVLEAVVKRLNKTGNPMEAARVGSNEVAVAVLASAGTNIVVLFPVAMMSGLIGRFMKPLAMTMLLMTVVSLFVSFTLTPILCSLLLKPGINKGLIFRMGKRFDAGLSSFLAVFLRFLNLCDSNRAVSLAVNGGIFALFILSLSLAGSLGSSMIDKVDNGQISVKFEFPTYFTLKETQKRLSEAEALLIDLPEVRTRLTMIGKAEGMLGQNSEGVYLAQLLLVLTDKTERSLGIDELIDMTRQRLKDYAGAISTIGVPDVVGGQKIDIELKISGDDLAVLDSLALSTAGIAREQGGFFDVDTTVRQGKSEIVFSPKREILSDLNLAVTTPGLMLRGNIEGLKAGTYKKGDRNYDIVVKLERVRGRDQVLNFIVPGSPGQPVTMSTLTDVSEKMSPVQITRMDKKRVNKFFSMLSPELPLGTAVSQLTRAVKEKLNVPAGYDFTFVGMYEIMADAQKAFGEAGIIAIVLTYLLLAAILESFVQPILIMITLPLGLIGVILALFFAGQSFSIFVLMAIVMMIGIVVNDAILIMEQFNVHVKEGIPMHKAMICATCEQFRPVAMITLAAVLGMWPVAFGRGLGAEIRNGVGIASLGGILVSGILTLLVLPLLFNLITRRLSRKNGSHAGSGEI
ncbi:MAG: efflux RND transporter permease subunit [Candidatus Wallbacteria bacterium]|nr:efflux RND transporter permease subunit [Candidatus Wallbacteria bacterium]